MHTPTQQLVLVSEAKIFDILPGSLGPRLEASGVLAKGEMFYVIFDNLPHIACISPQLSRAAGGNHLIIQERGHRSGFEDIAHDSLSGRFYVLIESLPRGRGTFMAAVQEYDANFRYTGIAWLDFPFDRPNKGLEGLTCVHRDGQAYLLGLCEGNRCKGGDAGRVPGGGRIHVFRRGQRDWDRVAEIRLPETVLFRDYSGIAVAGDRIAVVSQESSALWIGRLAPDSWQVTAAGVSYALPSGYPTLGQSDRVELLGTEGTMIIDDDHMDHLLYSEKGIPHAYVPDHGVKMAFLGSNTAGDWAVGDFWGPLGNETRAWLDHLATGAPTVHTTPQQARINLETTIAIERAVKSGQPVRLPLQAED